MKLITKEIERAFEKQGYTGNMSSKNIKVVMKLFNPVGAGTWYLYEKESNDIFYAFANLGDIQCAECGPISLHEMESVKLPLGLKIERDMYFKPLSISLQEVINTIKNGGHI